MQVWNIEDLEQWEQALTDLCEAGRDNGFPLDDLINNLRESAERLERKQAFPVRS